MNSFEIIRTVRLTEKGTRQGDKFNQYTIVADPRANKTQIRQAVQDLFKVKVVKVLIRICFLAPLDIVRYAGSKTETVSGAR